MNKKIKILHLEDSIKDSELVQSIIQNGEIEHDYFLADNEKDFKAILGHENIDIILSDYSLPDYNGNEALKIAREKYSNIRFIFVSGKIDEDAAIDAMLYGATDYVFKNKLERLVPAIKRAMHEHELENKRKRAEINLEEKNELLEAQNIKYVQINKELVFQNEEKEKRASELVIADKELVFQNEEKEKRASELVIADKELGFQQEEKGKRAAELIIANSELVFQNQEKEKRAAELIIANRELIFQNEEKEKRAAELIIANKELLFQNNEKEERAAELIIANNELAFQNLEKEKRAAELILANKELAFQNLEKENRAAELILANKELAFQNNEKEERAAELIIANNELAFQNMEKEKRAAELILANKELAFQNNEKEERAAELIIANKELAFQNNEKEERAAELIIANNELAFQNLEKEKRAAELILANKELAFQNLEKENRAAELILANKELAFQNNEKEERAAELIIANNELAFQNMEKEKRAAELILANKELAFQNNEKEERAAELIIANKELAFQNMEKEKRAAELILANKELAFQNNEKEERAAELIIANKELAFQNLEKEKRAAELIVAKEKAEESDHLKSAFLATMNHELRTPLNHILGFSEIIYSSTDDDDIKEWSHIILESGTGLLNIIEDIFDLALAEQGQIKIRKQSFKGIDIFLENRKNLDEIIVNAGKENEIKLVYKPDSKLLQTFLIADRSKINQVLVNLFKNAEKFTSKGTIEFGLYQKDQNEIVFYVKDTGVGIQEDKLDVIFQFFRQLDDSNTRYYGGVGIGLAISKKIAEAMNARIVVESEVGKGTTFFLHVPVKIAALVLQVPESDKDVTTPDLTGKTILVAEDDPISMRLIRMLLDTTHATLVEAVNGQEAIEKLVEFQNIDLVLMDLKMPVLDGYKATSQIKAIWPDIKIIALTAYSIVKEKKLAFLAGCDDIIVKPIDKQILFAKLKAVL